MLKVNAFKQPPALCGPTSLRMVLDYYGVRTTEREIVRRSQYNARFRDGSGAKKLVRAAKHFGFHARLQDNASFSRLRDLVLNKKIPVIVNWYDAIIPPVGAPDGHYSVVVDITKEHIILVDSEIGGKRKIPILYFKRLWFDFSPHYLRTPKALVVRRMIVVRP